MCMKRCIVFCLQAMFEANRKFWKQRREAKAAAKAAAAVDEQDETIFKTDSAKEQAPAGEEKSDENGDGSSAASEGTTRQPPESDGKEKMTCKPKCWVSLRVLAAGACLPCFRSGISARPPSSFLRRVVPNKTRRRLRPPPTCTGSLWPGRLI